MVARELDAANRHGVEIWADDGQSAFRDVQRDVYYLRIAMPRRIVSRVELDHQTLHLLRRSGLVDYIDEQLARGAARLRGATILALLDDHERPIDFATDDEFAAQHIERAALKMGETSERLMALLAKTRSA
jgi:hypothetical protein